MAHSRETRPTPDTGKRTRSEHRTPAPRKAEKLLESEPTSTSVAANPLTKSATMRQIFRTNLDDLLTVVGLSRKDTAAEMGVPYSLIRRFVSAGVSRREERNAEYLEKIARFFCLPEVAWLWRADCIDCLLASGQGRHFVEAFRPRSEAQRQVLQAKLTEKERHLLHLMNRALGYFSGTQEPSQIDEDLGKARALLRSSKAPLFRQLMRELLASAAADEMISLRDTKTP